MLSMIGTEERMVDYLFKIADSITAGIIICLLGLKWKKVYHFCLPAVVIARIIFVILDFHLVIEKDCDLRQYLDFYDLPSHLFRLVIPASMLFLT